MKMYIVLGFLSLLLISCNTKNGETTDTKEKEEVKREKKERNNLKSLMIITPAKSVTSKSYDVDINKNDTIYKLFSGNLYDFNEDGNFVSTKFFKVDGEIINETKYIYDDDGNLIGTDLLIDGSRQNYSVIEKTDIEDKFTETTFNNSGEIVSVNEFIKDEFGYIIKRISGDTKNTYVYNENNDLAEYTLVIKNYNVNSKYVLVYNEEIFPVETQEYDDKGDLISVLEHTYVLDDRGNWIRKNTYSFKELVAVETREFVY